MLKELYLTTLDYLVKAVEAKEAELAVAIGRFRRERLEAELGNLQKRFQTELGYLRTVTNEGPK